MKNMRGIIDPYTLGFLLSLVGALTLGPKMTTDSNTATSKTQTVNSAKAHKSLNQSQD